jgi:hypothetical protein
MSIRMEHQVENTYSLNAVVDRLCFTYPFKRVNFRAKVISSVTIHMDLTS